MQIVQDADIYAASSPAFSSAVQLLVMIQSIMSLFSTQVPLRVSYPFKLSGEIRFSEVNLTIGTHRSSSLVQQREISPQ